MGRLRLGLGFEGTLYPARLGPAETPNLGLAPAAAVLERLVAIANKYELIVYPLAPAKGQGLAIRGWLLTQLESYFLGLAYEQPLAHAIALIGAITVAERRDVDAVDLIVEVGGLPAAEDLERFGALFETMPPLLTA